LWAVISPPVQLISELGIVMSAAPRLSIGLGVVVTSQALLRGTRQAQKSASPTQPVTSVETVMSGRERILRELARMPAPAEIELACEVIR
jgi:hypothetical protein